MAALVSRVERNVMPQRANYRIFLHFNVFSEPLVIEIMQFFMSVAQLLSVISAAYRYGLILVNFISIYYTKWALLYEYVLKMYSFFIALNVLLFYNSGFLLRILSVTFHCTFSEIFIYLADVKE